ncbi:M20/M25/M40 family metallo-hydrolase [Actinacidiphila sp. bgisy160]|uniref:M20/M25/M40 family metallo-hydrolase n=1 Tax=Actinacidiphila sp. bgisy160 TaxID=3413796 RepID=UPI003D70F382
MFGERLAAGLAATAGRVEQPPGPDGAHLVAYWNGRETEDLAGDGLSAGHTLLVAHSDIVFPAGTISRRPFTLAEDGDTVTGPGVFDMKGSLVAVELAMELLSRTGATPRRPVRLVPLGSSGGAGDTNLTGALGIPTVDGLGPAGADAHGEDEYASLSALLERAALIAAFLDTH